MKALEVVWHHGKSLVNRGVEKFNAKRTSPVVASLLMVFAFLLSLARSKGVAMFLFALAFVAMFTGNAWATDPAPPDASTIVTTATTTFYAVGTLVSAAVGFFIIVKIVKWVRK